MDVCALSEEHADAAARVHRVSFDQRLPWISSLHTPDEDRAFFRGNVFRDCDVYGAFDIGELIGIIAFREGWIDQLYVIPQAQGRGVGTALLTVAKSAYAELSLWTFEKNMAARRFYERHGFMKVEETDGSCNEEREPDVRYRWRR